MSHGFGPASDTKEMISLIHASKTQRLLKSNLHGCLPRNQGIVPIPGTRKLDRLKENLGAVDVELSTEEIRDLNDAFSKIEIVGDWYPAEYANFIDK
ncbi:MULTISPECIES: hypothetical protein [unclassified Bacillus (in: firmicutes)]|uniref:hypothetical protein n=1 Tax=unclassified Bacillus (in: firmicutes) TaxID=185979 RepID=UPI0020D26641|nr:MULTISPECIES: hypothetical protein [unclassified Bacillus (in: firmicutes)]